MSVKESQSVAIHTFPPKCDYDNFSITEITTSGTQVKKIFIKPSVRAGKPPFVPSPRPSAQKLI